MISLHKGKQMFSGTCHLQYYIQVDIRCLQQGSRLLSQLVNVRDTPATPIALINMLVTSPPDSPTTCTGIKTCNIANTIPANPMTTSTSDKVNAQPPHTEDWKDTLRVMQRTDAFCKHISKRLPSGRAHSHKVDTFTHIKGLVYKHVMDSN